MDNSPSSKTRLRNAKKKKTHRQVGVDLVLVDVAGHVLDLGVIGLIGGGSRGSGRLTSSHGGKARSTVNTRSSDGSEVRRGRGSKSGRKSGDGDAGQSAGRRVGQPSHSRKGHDQIAQLAREEEKEAIEQGSKELQK